MSSLVLMSYQQPVKGNKFRWGVHLSKQDTKKHPLAWATIKGPYRKHDPEFKRTRNLETVHTAHGVRAFYKERTNWRVSIPFIGSLVKPFLKKK